MATPTITYLNYVNGQFVEETIGSESYTLVASSSDCVTWKAGTYVVGADYNGDGVINAEDAALGTNTFTLSSGAEVSGAVNLIIADGFTLNVSGVNKGVPGIYYAYDDDNNSLTISGQTNGTGVLNATGDDDCAGIGGGFFGAGKNITINGGTVTATGGRDAAGIGGGRMGDSENITINGGTVTANGGRDAAGIGGGNSGSAEKITINGGTVTATGDGAGAGIGGGNYADGENITINGGTVTANGDKDGAGIGGGSYGTAQNIKINGGTVTATGGQSGVSGIGAGKSGYSYYIYVSDSVFIKADTNSTVSSAPIDHESTTELHSELSGKQYAVVLPKTYVLDTTLETDAATSATINNQTYNGKIGDGMFYNDQTSFDAKTDGAKIIKNADYQTSAKTVFGGSYLQIDGGSYKNLVGGEKIDSATTDPGDLTVAINGGSFSNAVTGGDGIVAAVNYEREGDVNLSISGGTFETWAVGGEFYCPTVLTTAEDGSVELEGDVKFTISGGTFNGRIYGGCLSRTAELGGNTIIDGDVNLTFDANNTVTIYEHVVAGSRGSGKITGSTNVTFTGTGSNLIFDDKSVVFGGSNNDTYKRSSDGTETIKSTVEGDRNLIFDAFKGDFNAEIKLFSTATFKNGSEVAFTDSDLNLTPVETWNFEFGSSIEDLAKNDFSDDTLNFDMTDYDNSEWTVLSGSKDALTGLFDAESVIIGGETAELSQDNLSWCSTSYKLTKTNSGDTYSMVITKA